MNTFAAYLTRLLLGRFLLMLVCLLALLLALDVMVNSNRLLGRGADLSDLGRYMLLRSPIIISDVIKIATLLAGLLTFATLIRHGELTAMWNAGVSQFGLFLRLLPMAALLGLLQFAVDDFAVPVGFEELRSWGIVRDNDPDEASLTEGVTWIHIGSDIVRVPTENIGEGRLSNFTIFERDGNGTLLGRLDVVGAHYDGGVWVLSDITERAVGRGLPRHSDTREWRISLDPESLRNLSAHPRNLSFDQISRFAGGDGQGTWAPYLYRTWLYEKISTCLVPLLMLLLCAALGQQSQRGGRVELLFLGGVAVGFAFFIFNGITLAMGEVGLLPPLIASAVPLVAFTAVAMSIIYWHELKNRPA
ncbi:LptF/LptG family permease [Pelagibius marinus]|uniref:LptF/LptG family permease n=1 Tax=Pelagibius marinus TaxID=2762760 RepID=UPI001872638B|nr:LptF/LptG family permease [Pelagibius marinus]